jgi:hypothetical protein
LGISLVTLGTETKANDSKPESIDKRHTLYYVWIMKYYDWSLTKNEQLKTERQVLFEDVVLAITSGDLLDTIEHPNKKKYPNQKIFIVKINDYVYLVPFVEDENIIFLKTIIPSRKMIQKYLGKK